MASWNCDGVPKDGKQYPNAEPHAPYENFGPDCVMCGLPKEAMLPGSQRKQRSPGSRNNKAVPIALGVSLLVFLLSGSFLWGRVRGCPVGQAKMNGVCIPEDIETKQPERFSSGERSLFSDRKNVDLDRGTEAFRDGNYEEAINFFEKAIAGARNDPEPQIYLNNARARRQGSPLAIAVVVPATNRSAAAREILRGVADAQTQFNETGGIGDRLLEVAIVNDGNEEEVAREVAQELSENQAILAVVGHNSSNATIAALPAYERANLAVISPTSTSTSLQSPVFFRTVPSDAIAGQQLADYAQDRREIDKLVIFFDSQSAYSKSLLEAFKDSFPSSDIVAEIDLQQSDLDIQKEVERSAEENAEALVLFPSASSTSIALAIATQNADLPSAQRMALLGGDALYNPETLVQGGQAVEDLVLAVPWIADPSGANYAQDAEQRWGGTVSWRTATSYDATRALVRALSEDASRQKVLDRLKQVNLSARETSGEPLQFTSEGERAGDLLLVRATQDAPAPEGAKFGFQKLP